MITVTLSIEEYEELKRKADAYENQSKTLETLFGGYTKIGQGIQTIPKKK